MEIPLSILYPKFTFIPARGALLPDIRLPHDYERLVPKFYRLGGKKTIEDFTTEVRTIPFGMSSQPFDIRLNWHEKYGLRNISIGIHGGLDLDSERSDPCFVEHNLGRDTGPLAGAIAMRYVSELLKIKVD